ncbi:unnamed protein product [Durusdinium trenchii]|uniref:Uncharacterized protein n=1 Tax=Durusdinium trenchii TaxID=1381693 RepID=A0ABP0LFR6_9DINO
MAHIGLQPFVSGLDWIPRWSSTIFNPRKTTRKTTIHSVRGARKAPGAAYAEVLSSDPFPAEAEKRALAALAWFGFEAWKRYSEDESNSSASTWKIVSRENSRLLKRSVDSFRCACTSKQ